MRSVLAIVAFSALAVGSAAQNPNVSSDCHALRLMKRLAKIDDYLSAGMLEMIDKQERVSCSALSGAETILWGAGRTAKYADGSWAFPNGITALVPEGRLGYPRGLPAKLVEKSGEFTLRYPNGVAARLTDGSWRQPDGSCATMSSLVSWACSRISAAQCQERRADIENARGDDRDLAVMELAWRAK